MSHGTGFGRVIEVPLGPAEFIVGATGRADQLVNNIVLTRRGANGELSSYECGSKSGGKYYDANIPVSSPASHGPCYLRYTRGACNIAGYDCTEIEASTTPSSTTSSTGASTIGWGYFGIISTVQFVWSCDGLLESTEMV